MNKSKKITHAKRDHFSSNGEHFSHHQKYLYSDQDIFLRELISNAVDATNKLKTLSSRGEVAGELGDLTIAVSIDKENDTLTISDKGIGMTGEEMEKYLNQVAFSSAKEFLEKYQNESSIIGHFGLGFYSAFMVADRVEVVSHSYKKDSKGMKWSCEGDISYTIEESERASRGTDVILYVGEENKDYLEEQKIQELLSTYCRFLPVPIQFGTKTETVEEGEGEDKKETEIEVPHIINNTHPAWKKQPSELSEEDYKNFYRELHPFSAPPLFWIHLNIDYPFNLTGFCISQSWVMLWRCKRTRSNCIVIRFM